MWMFEQLAVHDNESVLGASCILGDLIWRWNDWMASDLPHAALPDLNEDRRGDVDHRGVLCPGGAGPLRHGQHGQGWGQQGEGAPLQDGQSAGDGGRGGEEPPPSSYCLAERE